jgi:hypothetical protein
MCRLMRVSCAIYVANMLWEVIIETLCYMTNSESSLLSFKVCLNLSYFPEETDTETETTTTTTTATATATTTN